MAKRLDVNLDIDFKPNIDEAITIYAIKTMTRCDTDESGWHLDFGSERNVGYYTNLQFALETVLDNTCDIWETIYNYAMIEEIGEGLYGSAGMRTWWFKWNREKMCYEPIKAPEPALHQFGFIMG